MRRYSKGKKEKKKKKDSYITVLIQINIKMYSTQTGCCSHLPFYIKIRINVRLLHYVSNTLTDERLTLHKGFSVVS